MVSLQQRVIEGLTLSSDFEVIVTGVGSGHVPSLDEDAAAEAAACMSALLRDLREVAGASDAKRVVTMVVTEGIDDQARAASEALVQAARGVTQALTREEPGGIRACNVVVAHAGDLAEARRLIGLLDDPCSDYVMGACLDLRGADA